MGQRGENRHGAGLKEVFQSLGVDVLDVTYVTEVDWLYGALHTHNQIEVSAGKANGVDTKGLQTRNQILVDKSAVNHRHDLQHLGAGDSSAIDHLGLHAQPGRHLGGDLAASVHENLSALEA